MRTRELTRRHPLVGACVFVGAAWMVFASASRASGPPAQEVVEEAVLATIGDETVSRQAVEELVRAQLLAAEVTHDKRRHELLASAVKRLVRERLLDDYAASKQLSSEQVLEQEIAAKVEVSEEDISEFFEQNQARMQGRTLEQIAPQISDYLKQQRRADLEDAFFVALEDEHDVVYRLEPYRVAIDNEGQPSFGP